MANQFEIIYDWRCLIKVGKILWSSAGFLGRPELSKPVKSHANEGVGDFNGFYPSLLAAFLRWFFSFLRLNMSSSFLSFQFLCVSGAFAGSFARVGSSSLEIPTRPPAFQSFSLWTGIECVFAIDVRLHTGCMWLKDGRPDWLAKRPCRGLDRNGSWMMIDFNASIQERKARKRERGNEREDAREFCCQTVFLLHSSHMTRSIRQSTNHCPAYPENHSFPLPMWGQTGRHDPCVTGWDDCTVGTMPRESSRYLHFMAFSSFSHQTRWSVQVFCHVVCNGNGCEKSFSKNDAEKQRSNRGVQAVRLSVKHRSHRWSCCSWRFTGATRHRMSRGLCPRTILTRAAE